MYQAHVLISEAGEEVVHQEAPNNLVLNLLQMRNTSIIQAWQLPFPFFHITVEQAAVDGVKGQYQCAEEEAPEKQEALAAQESAKARQEEKRQDWRPKFCASQDPDWSKQM